MPPVNAGIYSLAGFIYQIKVFILKLISSNEQQQVEYETLDDVAIRQISDLETIEEKLLCRFGNSDSFTAIQVKKADVSDSESDRILYNWLIALNRANIKEFALYHPTEYSISTKAFDISPDEHYKKIINSSRRSDALISQVKSIYKDDKKHFVDHFVYIKSNCRIYAMVDIDQKIYDALSSILHKNGVGEHCYDSRVYELIKRINSFVFNDISHKRPYSCSYASFMTLCDLVCQDIQNERINPDFSTFCVANSIDLFDPSISELREYKQLAKCNLPEKLIINNLIYKLYYGDIRYRYLYNNNLTLVNNIESTAFANFTDVRLELMSDNRDTPQRRLNETKKRTISYVSNEQSQWGSYIYLTKADTDAEKMISWEDE